MAGLLAIHSSKTQYESSGYPSLKLGSLVYMLMRSIQHRGNALCEVQTKRVVTSQRGLLPEEGVFERRFENAYRSNTVIADVRKGVSSPRSIFFSGSAFDGFVTNKDELERVYEGTDLNDYQKISAVLRRRPDEDPYKIMDFYSERMKGNMLIEVENGFVAMKDKSAYAPLYLASFPEIGLYVVCSEDCSESAFSMSVVQKDEEKSKEHYFEPSGNEVTIRELLGIESRKGIFKEIETGCMIQAQNGEIKIFYSEDTKPEIDPHEIVHRMNPASTFRGRSVYSWRKEIGKALADMYETELSSADIIFPIPDSPRPIAKGIWERLHEKGYKAEIGEYYFDKDRSVSQSSQQINIEKEEGFSKIGIRELVEGKIAVVVEDSIIGGTSARKTAEDMILHQARGHYFVSGELPIIDELQIGIKSKKKNLLARKFLGEVGTIRDMNKRVSEEVGTKVLYNIDANLAASLGLSKYEIWVPNEIRIPLELLN